ncbi:MAG: DUF3786 domain-containing protein [Deltaproteobacteria bacterium]|nr:DUF3786 domain-containing protein [Candidatus Anaeroferrophillus wilburensis]MBN2889291.1 DUF3786 domain-containing protein [Deltaproteobacteria bacterium]
MQKQKNYQQTFTLAADRLTATDISYLQDHPGISWQETATGVTLSLPFFQRPYSITYPQLDFSCPEESVISLVSKIIILHYLANANRKAHAGQLVNYGAITGGSFYFPVFKRKTTDILASKLGNDGNLFSKAGERLAAAAGPVGDVSFTINALPGIDLTMVFWEGDEDFPPAYDILFDAAIDHYLSLEDIVVLAQMATKRVLARATADQPGD